MAATSNYWEKLHRQQKAEMIKEIDALVLKLQTGTVSYFKGELNKILAKYREPHPETADHFFKEDDGTKRVAWFQSWM